MLRNNFVTAKEDTRNNNITVIRNTESNESNITSIIRRGSIYWVDLPKIEGSSIQAGIHPCLVLQNDMGNKYSPNVQVCCLTSRIMKKRMPTHVNIQSNYMNNLSKDSVILVETITNVPKTLVGDYIGKIDYKTMELVDEAVEIQMGLKKFDKNFVNNLIFNINNMKEMFEKYQDPTLKILADNNISELKNYCEKHKRDYTMFYDDISNRRLEYVM